jgi:AcrR family transcriptional regulator
MLEDIKTIARQQMAENGTASVSLSAIARVLEVSQPALYRYYANRDELVTALLVDTYSDLADVMEKASTVPPPNAFGKRLLSVMLAIRDWALKHPVDFELIYGNPIPGYHAPEEATQPAARRGFAVVLRILGEAHAAGALKPRAEYLDLPKSIQVNLPAGESSPSETLPPVVVHLGILGWCLTHGMIMLELHHHTTALLDDPATLYQFEAQNLLQGMGLEV